MWLSGLEDLVLEDVRNHLGLPFLNVGECGNISSTIAGDKCAAIMSISKKQIEGGSHVIGINVGNGPLSGPAVMETFVKIAGTRPEIAKAPFMLNASNFDVAMAGLKHCQGKCIVNSISLKAGEEVFKTQATLLKKHGAAVVVVAFDKEDESTAESDKVRICKRSYDILVNEVHFPPEDIIFDPNVKLLSENLVFNKTPDATDKIQERIRWEMACLDAEKNGLQLVAKSINFPLLDAASSTISATYRMSKEKRWFKTNVLCIVRLQSFGRKIIACEKVKRIRDPYAYMTFDKLNTLHEKEVARMEVAAKTKEYKLAEDLKEKLEPLKAALESKRPLTRDVFESKISEIQKKLDDAVSRKAYQEITPLNSELDKLVEQRRDLPTLDELKEAVRIAAKDEADAVARREFTGAASYQAALDNALKRLESSYLKMTFNELDELHEKEVA